MVKLTEAKKGFVLLSGRCVVELSLAWLTRFRRLSPGFERMPKALARLHFVVLAMLMLSKAALLLASEAGSRHHLALRVKIYL